MESEEYLLLVVYEGPIAVLNVTELRSDAILVTKGHVESISLPLLSHASVKQYLGKGVVEDGNGNKRALLGWLWKAAVQPVLQELGYFPQIVHPWPRIWWIEVGLMAQAPIHAATKYPEAVL